MTLDLLRIEVDIGWTRDATGRLVATRVPSGGWSAPCLLVASSGAERFACVSDAVPLDVAAEAERSAVDPASGSPDAADELQARVEAIVGPTRIGGGPCYVVPAGTTATSDAFIETSTAVDAEALRGRMPDKDVDGTYGPWAIAVVDGEVAAMCCTARKTDAAVEAGVWTYMPYRGRGHAAAVTAAWAALHPPDVIRFYSTAYTNTSSQRVTCRLGLPHIGWMWQLLAAS